MALANLFVIASLVMVVAVLAATVLGLLALLEGATYPAALSRALGAFMAVVTLAATVTSALKCVLA